MNDPVPTRRETVGFESQNVSAPPGIRHHSDTLLLNPTTYRAKIDCAGCPQGRQPAHSGADDQIRTGDPHLGKVMLYQLSYVREAPNRSREIFTPHSPDEDRRVV